MSIFTQSNMMHANILTKGLENMKTMKVQYYLFYRLIWLLVTC